MKTMKVEGAQGAEARTAKDRWGRKLKADGGGWRGGVRSGEWVMEEGKRSEASRKRFRTLGFC